MLCDELTKENVFPLVVDATCFFKPGSPAYFAAISALLRAGCAEDARGMTPAGVLTGPSAATFSLCISAADLWSKWCSPAVETVDASAGVVAERAAPAEGVAARNC